MNNLSIFILKSLRKVYVRVFNKKIARPVCETNPDIISEIIYDSLKADKPCMIARFGSNELNTLLNYKSIKSQSKSIVSYIKGDQYDWWWNTENIKLLNVGAGFFPPETGKIEQYCQLINQDMSQIDILGSWQSNERFIDADLKLVVKVDRGLIDPFFTTQPWTKALAGKKVLVVHPFKKSIENQYKRKDLIFPNGLLPDFELTVIQAVQSIAGEKTPFNDWFEALEYMKAEIDKVDYDICLIGAGAYGFHLAAHVKRMGKKSIHIGGSLQLLFGIIGKRWETPGYAKNSDYAALINEYWVRPDNSEIPMNSNIVENGCYF